MHGTVSVNTLNLLLKVENNTQYVTYLGCADFVERNKDERLQETAERQVIAISECNQYQQRHLGNKDEQAEDERPAFLRREIQNEEIRREVVADVPPRHMVEVGLLEKLVAIATGEDVIKHYSVRIEQNM